jgi:hypothetical protein
MNSINYTPSLQSQSTALLDSGCTVHFLLSNAHCKNKLLTQTPLEVHLPNGATIASTHTETLNLPSLPHASRQAHILPVLAHHSLLSVGQMCDSGCVITFTAKKVVVKNGATTILTGQRDKESGVWCTHTLCTQYIWTKSNKDTITYLHACCFSPVQDT